jgi:transposase, IS30 family
MPLYLAYEEMKHLVKSQRDEIEILVRKWYKNREIAKVLWYSHTTINHEIRTNSVRWVYNAKKAEHKSYARRKSCKKQNKKIRDNDDLERYICEKLYENWSPEEIAGVWNKYNEVEISVPSIYGYIDSRYGYGLSEHLYSRRRKKRKRSMREKREVIKDRVMIDARPMRIWRKKYFGNYEVDLVMWKQGIKACLLVLIEMVTRYKIVYWIPSKEARVVEEKLKEAIQKYSIRSMTFDNGKEFSNHINLWIPTYFCYPRSPREKPQVERWNGNIRWYYPKWTDFTGVSQKEIDNVMRKINMRPMKCLNRDTPYTLFHKKILSRVETLGV